MRNSLIYHPQGMIGRRPQPVLSHSLLYNLPPVPRLTRYQRRRCILSQRENMLNHIGGWFGPVGEPIPNCCIGPAPPRLRCFSSRSPWTKKRSCHCIHVQGPKWQQRISLSYTPSRCVRMNSLTTASSKGWNFGRGSAPKVMVTTDKIVMMALGEESAAGMEKN